MNGTTGKSGRRPAAPRKSSETRLSRLRKPAELAVDEWQRALRKQFGREQRFVVENLGEDPVFSEFAVYNPESRSRYRVLIRGANAGENHCSCPDFATNDLGTCKHVEFLLAQIGSRPGGRRALEAGFSGAFSELFLDHAGRRRIRLRPGREFPEDVRESASRLF
ncbi:SWIM zinc finger family protein, partial [Accumulibacter sp.]